MKSKDQFPTNQTLNELYGSAGNTYEMQQAMVKMWAEMSLRFSPTWKNRNGDIDGLEFKGWMTSLARYGPNGIAYAMAAVKNAGSGYCPNLNQFEGYCRQAGMGGSKEGLIEGSEKFHGAKLKPTPSGVPLCWTIPPWQPYSYADLMASGHPEDAQAASMMAVQP